MAFQEYLKCLYICKIIKYALLSFFQSLGSMFFTARSTVCDNVHGSLDLYLLLASHDQNGKLLKMIPLKLFSWGVNISYLDSFSGIFDL